MKRLVVIIVILVIIFVAMFMRQKSIIKANNNITIQDVQSIETYITKIYMWKEITGEALPDFEDINQANDVWIWEVVKKNLEDYELSYDQIEEKAKELFGSDFTKQFPTEGTEYLKYNEETSMYQAEGGGLDEQEDNFLLNKIEENQQGYEVEIIEYLEDYSGIENEDNNEIIIKNLNEEEIGRVKNEEEEKAKDIVKENIDKFTKKKIYIEKKEEQNYYIKKVEKI